MRHGLWAVVAVLTLAQCASADYLVIRINLAGGEADPKPGPKPPPGNLIGVPPGNQIGVPPGNQVGIPPRPPGMQMGGGTPNIGVPPNTGIPPNIGMPPNTGMPPPPPPPPPPQPPPTSKGEWFMVVVEGDLKKRGSEVYFDHRWGKTPINLLDQVRERAYLHLEEEAPLERRVETRAAEFRKDPLRFAEWMLENWNMFPGTGSRFSMRKRFEELLDQLSEDPNIKPDSPEAKRVATLLEARKRLTEAFGGLESDDKIVAEVKRLAEKVDADSKLDWRVMGSESPYQIIYPAREEKNAEQRLRRLEHFYAGFHYWFALRGKVLKHPDRQLVCVLAKDVTQYRNLASVFDDPPSIQDGFYTGMENVVVFSPARVDAIFHNFQSQAVAFEAELRKEGLSYEKLVKGEKLPEKLIKDIAGRDNDARTKALTLITYGRIVGLALHGAHEEGEIASITHESVMQLAHGCGIVPRRVRLPEAVRFGLGSLFETPKSRVIGSLNQPAIFPGIATPHWTYVPLAKSLAQNENKKFKLDGEREIPLGTLSILHVIKDQSFLDAAKGEQELRDLLLDKARAESWALTYFLATGTKRDGTPYLNDLLAFYGELEKLPRDQDLDALVIERTFVRAFQLGQQDKPDELDPAKLEKIEADWKKAINAESLLHTIEFKTPGSK